MRKDNQDLAKAVENFCRLNPGTVTIDHDEVTPHVTVGSVPITAEDVLEIRRLGHNAIVDMCEDNEREGELAKAAHIEHFPCFVPDTRSPSPTQFDDVSQYIYDRVKAGKRVYVHCHAGMGRAPTVTCAYLIRFCDYTVEQAIDFLKLKRRYHRVSPDQRRGLTEFAEKHALSSTKDNGGRNGK